MKYYSKNCISAYLLQTPSVGPCCGNKCEIQRSYEGLSSSTKNTFASTRRKAWSHETKSMIISGHGILLFLLAIKTYKVHWLELIFEVYCVFVLFFWIKSLGTCGSFVPLLMLLPRYVIMDRHDRIMASITIAIASDRRRNISNILN